MTFGTFLTYSGLSILVGSLSALLVVILFCSLLLLYIKRIEEKELEVRFGQEYVDYKASTPFIIPKLSRKTRN
jgi:protein-S-isoprenylcysteine O-methyltransferase Ste14